MIHYRAYGSADGFVWLVYENDDKPGARGRIGTKEPFQMRERRISPPAIIRHIEIAWLLI